MPRKKIPEFVSNGFCYCYLRVSTSHQGKSGKGLQSQAHECQMKARQLDLQFHDEHYDTVQEMEPRPGHFIDKEHSAYKIDFKNREAGEKLLELAKYGDTIIIAKMDRGFRSVTDFCAMSGELAERGIRLVIVKPRIDLGTAIGRMLARYLACLAQWESERKGERISQALREKRMRDTAQEARERTGTINMPSEWRSVPKSEPSGLAMTPGKIHVYIRCSHRDSAESGLGLAAQLRDCQKYADMMIEQNPQLSMGESFTDVAVSAKHFPLRLRQAGKIMNEVAKSGDHVIFASLDRGFRSVADLASTIPRWQERGIEVHFVDEGICMSDPGGELLAGAVVQFAQFEADIAAERAREARSQLVAHGKYIGGREPNLWTLRHFYGKKVLVPSKRKIAVFRLMNLMRRNGLTIPDACIAVEILVAKHDGRVPIPQGGARVRSKISVQLGKSYPRSMRGWAYPPFDQVWYFRSMGQITRATEALRKVGATKRAAKAEYEAKQKRWEGEPE